MQNNGNLFEGVFDEMVSVPDPNQMTQEEEADYWAGEGTLQILVLLNLPATGEHDRVFEYDVLEASGCLGGANETVGIDYLLQYIWGVLDMKYPLKEGFTYTFHDVTAFWTHGDGYTSEDDVDYYYSALTQDWHLWSWFKTKVAATWWKHIGWRLQK